MENNPATTNCSNTDSYKQQSRLRRTSIHCSVDPTRRATMARTNCPCVRREVADRDSLHPLDGARSINLPRVYTTFSVSRPSATWVHQAKMTRALMPIDCVARVWYALPIYSPEIWIGCKCVAWNDLRVSFVGIFCRLFEFQSYRVHCSI